MIMTNKGSFAALRPLLALLVTLSAGCADRSHLSGNHGRAYSEAFGRQTVNPEPRPADPRAIQGLDSQEASAVAHTYRRGLSGKEGSGDSAQPMVIMNGGASPQSPYMPPPSVPNGQ